MKRSSLLPLMLCASCAACARSHDRPAAYPPPAEAPADEEAQGNGDGDTLERAGNIATQPVRDIGVSKAKIPPVLGEAAEAPYAIPKSRKCSGLAKEIARLDEALGPDFDVKEEKGENRVGKVAEAGGRMIVNSLIPFRGLVREISGAAPADRRLQAAVSAGLARRGFLRGLAKARKCLFVARKD